MSENTHKQLCCIMVALAMLAAAAGRASAAPQAAADAVSSATRDMPVLHDPDNATDNGSAAGDYDVVVIGAGGGGLAAAAKLALAGKKVLVLEQHSRVGGYMTNFTRSGYTWEASLHHFDGLDEKYGMNYPMLKDLDLLDRLTLVRMQYAYNLTYPDGKIYTVPCDPEAYRQYLLEKFPEEAKGIKKFFKALHAMATTMRIMNAQEQHNWLKAFWAWLDNPLYLLQLGTLVNASALDLLDGYFKDEKIKGVVSWLAVYSGAPLEETSAYVLMAMLSTYFYGGFYHFEGGSAAVSEALADVIRENGGQIKLGTMATKILLENNRATGVRTSDGRIYTCDYVVSNANARDTINHMIGRENLPTDYLQKLDSMQLSGSPMVVYLGVNKDYRAAFNGAHTISYNSYYIPPPGEGMVEVREPETTDYVIADFSVLHPDAAPEGKNVIEILFGASWDYENNWHAQEDYAAYKTLKEEMAATVIKRAEKYLPGLSENIEVMEVATPRTMAHYTMNPEGAIMGWKTDFTKMDASSLMERFPQQSPIENVFLAGAWSGMGGQSTVLRSGLMVAEKILAKK